MKNARNPRRSRRGVLAVALVLPLAALTACGGSGGSEGESIELTYTSIGSEKQSEDWLWLAEEVEKRTDGRVTFRNYFSGTLADATDTLKAVQDGRAQVGWVSPTYQPADFPVWSANNVQYISDNPEAVSRAVHDKYTEGSLLTEDFEDSGVQAVGFVTYGPNVVGTAEPVSTLDDLEGQVMRSSGTSDAIMKAAGARPTVLGSNELYEALERGTIDGFTQLPFATPAQLGLSEVTPYLTDIGSGAYSMGAFVMNQETWAELPKDVKDVFLEVSAELVEEWFVVQNGFDEEACATYKESGTELSRLPDGEIAELEKRSLDELVESWKTTAVDAGFERAAVDEYFTSYTEGVAEAEDLSTTYKNPFEACS